MTKLRKSNFNKEDIEEKLKEGLSIPKIAKTLEICDQTVRRRMKVLSEKWYDEVVKPNYIKRKEKIDKDEKESSEYRKILDSEFQSLLDKHKGAIELRVVKPAIEIIKEITKRDNRINEKLSIKALNIICNIFKDNIDLEILGLNAIIAASIYTQSFVSGKNISQGSIAISQNVSRPTLRKVFKIINLSPLEIRKIIQNPK